MRGCSSSTLVTGACPDVSVRNTGRCRCARMMSERETILFNQNQMIQIASIEPIPKEHRTSKRYFKPELSRRASRIRPKKKPRQIPHTLAWSLVSSFEANPRMRVHTADLRESSRPYVPIRSSPEEEGRNGLHVLPDSSPGKYPEQSM